MDSATTEKVRTAQQPIDDVFRICGFEVRATCAGPLGEKCHAFSMSAQSCERAASI